MPRLSRCKFFALTMNRSCAICSRRCWSATATRLKSAMAASPDLMPFVWPAIEDQPFDVVITDLGMPYLDGREVAKTLKRESPATPVIMLTGWGAFMKEDGLSARSKWTVCSAKPPRSRELRETLCRLSLAHDLAVK